ncbi:GSCFA domain-containing protein [Flavobacterium sedimenticola]|uniref:GSCFA domain-containing protein n=1 Tax=Flavobacterium sedimenticola TaxID=3043286 RepID=A0ABT6XRB3_9FLAO|nr:GSCFA domain-containing protein [Flavobacterium sedimenticola]MDI9257527.1 GSCFA domain-containing protein [Flavobacterium sedimenticola]
MNFSTKVPIAVYNFPLDYDARILLLGSCFTEHIGQKLDYFKFHTTTNPFGILFNPVSIEKVVDRAVNQRYFTETDIFFHNELWHCFEVHSELSHPDKDFFLHRLNQILEDLHLQIVTFSNVIITYGTAWVYRHNNSGNIVANCHKVPQKEFTKELLSPETIENAMQQTIASIQKVNPNCRFIFTVSPVRHLKDGFVENQWSKAHLIAAIHQGMNTPDNSTASMNYFPSYEIVMDELRDYRFYTEDMLHPNQTAIDYIWERFVHYCIKQACYPVMQEIDSIQKSLNHRPFHSDTQSHQKFLAAVRQKIAKLQSQFPHFQF